MEYPEIRQETSADTPAVYAVNLAAFGADNEARLVDLLRADEAFIPELSIVATLDGQIAGHILFTKIKIIDESGREHDSLALAPMAVLPAFQRQGIGSQLVRYGLARAQALGYRSVIVLGHEHYYPKFGFMPAARWNIKPPFEAPAAAFMGIELVKDGLKSVSGTVRYPKAFEMV